MIYSASLTKEEKIYELRSTLDQHNYLIYKLAEETELKLSSYILDKDGFWTAELGSIVELIGKRDNKRKFHKYNRIDECDYQYYAEKALSELQAKCRERKKLLPQYQRLWDHFKCPGHGIEIYYGLDFVVLTIPLETIVKYQIYFESPGWLSAYSRRFSNSSGKLHFGFNWSDPALLAFDNKIFFVEWKILEYQRQKNAQKCLDDFRNQCERFEVWERLVFTPQKVPS